MEATVSALVRKLEQNYITGSTVVSKYVNISQYDTLNRIDAYLNSKHTTPDKDSKGRDKPFFNIVTSAVNIWYRATDLDRKNIKIKATKSSQDIEAFLATVHLQNWMRKGYFGQFLNEWGRALAKYGSAVSKHVEKEGELYSIVVPWNRLITDTVDFDSNPVIERLYLTPAQLKTNKGYDQEIVTKLLDALKVRETTDKQRKDNLSDYIELYEVHGELPKSYLTGKDEDEDDFVQQMQVVSFVAGKDKGEFDDFCLIKGKETKSPYQKDDLIKEDGQTLSIGAVQNLFEAQWMVNHSIKSIKDQLDLASKLIFQTSDGNFVGQNALTAIETGDILIHAINQPLTQLANTSHDITSLQAFGAQWKTLGMEINGISEAMQGQNQPAGSAWRQTEALLQESHSLFELMTENKDLAIERMLREFILPSFKKSLNHNKEITGTLDSFGIQKIDSKYVPAEAIRRGNRQMVDIALSGQVAPQADFNVLAQQVKGEVSQQGNQRFFNPGEINWTEVFKDLEWDLEVDITGEQKDTQAVMETLNTALKFISTATPEQMNDPNWKLVWNKILEQTSVISPLEIVSIPPTPPQNPINKVSESMSYKDAPPDVQRQIEAQAGLQPSQMQSQAKPQPVAVK